MFFHIYLLKMFFFEGLLITNVECHIFETFFLYKREKVYLKLKKKKNVQASLR